jgi:serine/threonine protein phosphatase PrpC
MAHLLNQTEPQQSYMNSISDFVSQGRAGQDYAFSYSAKDGTSWLLAVDGHGSHDSYVCKVPDKDYVTWLKELNWAELIEEYGLETIAYIQTETQTWESTHGIGACIVLARVKDDVVDIRWKGDAECRVYKNGREAYRTPVHKIEDETERDRYEAEGIRYKTHQGWALNVLNGSECTMKSSKMVSYSGLIDRINISNCLGHSGSTGKEIGCASVDIHQVYDVVVVVGSDGLWDMVADTEVDAFDLSRLAFHGANEVVDWVIRRWEQEWDYVFYGQPTKKTYIPDRDDVCAALWTRCLVLS